jgi:hypothetical protein
VDPLKGLSERQILEQRVRHGRNELVPDKGTPFWKLVLKQFDDLLVKILIAAAVVDLIIAVINGEKGLGMFVEPGVIVLILIANGGCFPPAESFSFAANPMRLSLCAGPGSSHLRGVTGGATLCDSSVWSCSDGGSHHGEQCRESY